MTRSTVDLVSYDDSWPERSERFEMARRELIEVLDRLVVEVHHIGSTAVPGLIAKLTIDALAVHSVTAVLGRVEVLAQLGYEHRPSAMFADDHLFFRRIHDDERTHHLLVVAFGNAALADWLDLRDHLRANPDAALRYADAKRALADRHYNNRGAYVAAKTEVVEQLLSEARRRQGDSI